MQSNDVPLAEWHYQVLYKTPNRLALIIFLIFVLVGVVMGFFVNVNKFSLHSAYRDRLVRAYLGASRSANERRPNPFTGLDEHDNLQMHDLIRPVFNRDNFVKLDELVKGLAHPQTHRDRFIRSSLSQTTRDLIEKYNEMLIAETLGRTDNNHPHIYLSDGGHFENLGLYEMVLRRCHLIVVSDGSQDKDFDFESLGNAMSKIRTDLGIRITFNSIPISPREKKIPTFIKASNGEEEKKKKYCAIGRIHYSDVDEGQPAEIDGFLLYIKPTIYGSEPADVQNYARANAAFPHESTGDQMFSETQFESYRALGFHEVTEFAPKGASESKIDLKEMFERIEKYLGEETSKGLSDPTKTSNHPSLAC